MEKLAEDEKYMTSPTLHHQVGVHPVFNSPMVRTQFVKCACVICGKQSTELWNITDKLN